MPNANMYRRALARLTKAEAELKAARQELTDKRPAPGRETKADRIMKELQHKKGASLEGLAAKMEVLPKTVRSVISRESRRRGIQVTHRNGRYYAGQPVH